MSLFGSRSLRTLKFVVPSILGILIFVVPYEFHHVWNSTLGHLEELFLHEVAVYLPFAAVLLVSTGALATLLASVFKPKWVTESDLLSKLFLPAPFWVFSRLLGALFASFIYWEFGITALYRLDTGGVLLYSLAPKVLALATVLGLFIPLLLDFGLIEFIGTFARPIMRPLFKLPGRSSVDCMASWVGSGELAVMVTVKLHEEGEYNDREAAIAATTFSVIGIPYIYTVAELIDLRSHFLLLLVSVYSTLALLAFIMPRIWPLHCIPEVYSGKKGCRKRSTEDIPHHFSLVEWSLLTARNRAHSMTWLEYGKTVFYIFSSLVFGTLPLVLGWGGIFLLIAHLTPLLDVVSLPFNNLLSFFGIPEAEHVSASIVMAFIDQFLGAVVALDCETTGARFLCAAVSASSLISLTETGTHIWCSHIPIGLGKLVLIYLIRVALSFVVLIPVTHYFFL